MQILNILSYVLLLVLSIFDLRYKKVPIVFVGFFGVLSFGITILKIVIGEITFASRIFVAILGIFLLACAIMLKNQVGLGDGLVLFFTVMGKANLICFLSVIFMFALLFVISLIVIMYDLIRKKRERRKLPFIPFIFLGTLLAEVAI